jgi:predicted DNA-binding transcriptional regulator AlpA
MKGSAMASNNQQRFITIKEVCSRVCLGRTTVLTWEAIGRFPKAVRLSANKRVWLKQDIDDWMHEQHQASLLEEAA